MTILYEDNFLRALFHWNGSVWKSIWKETIIWLLMYYCVRMVLVYVIPLDQNDSVKFLIREFDEYSERFNFEFLLGFYVTQLVARWWTQANMISSPHDIMGIIAAYINGSDEEQQCLRLTTARYLLLYNTLAYRNFSSKLKILFPTNDKFLRVGLITKEEKEILDKAPAGIVHELPYQWITDIVKEHAGNHNSLLSTMGKHRGLIKQLVKHRDVMFPLVYTQTVTIAVYGYFLICLLGHQMDSQGCGKYVVFPLFTILRFIVIVGSLKVAEYLLQPFGEDDDDIDLCKFLSSFCTNVFTIAGYCSQYKPMKSTYRHAYDNQDQHFKELFECGVKKYEKIATKISKKFIRVVSTRKEVSRF